MWKLLRPDAQTVLRDEMAKKSLVRYFSVMQNERPAKFLVARKIPAEFEEKDQIELLWQEHTRLTEKFRKIETKVDTAKERLENLPDPPKSYLDLKIEIAKRVLGSCHFCMRRCGANRSRGEYGYCRCGSQIMISSVSEHLGEEPELVPSGTIFTMGCTMKCLHCQNWTISQWADIGTGYEPKDLAKEVERLRADGCRNVNLVGGEPTPWLLHWLRTFKHVNTNMPIVWNSNSYYSPETASLLAGFSDVYLLDFKYGPVDCSTRISDAPSYWEACKRNHLEAKRNGELIIRILILPQHLECCTRPILRWIAATLGKENRINIMFQYRPEWRAHEIPELSRALSNEEIDKGIQLARDTGLTNFLT